MTIDKIQLMYYYKTNKFFQVLKHKTKREVKDMNPYEQFFRLLLSLMGMVVKGTATIEWLNECFQSMLKDPENQQVVIPPKQKSFYGRRNRHFVSSKLLPEDWENLTQLFKNRRRCSLSLVEYYKRSNNKPTTFDDLRRLGLVSNSYPGSLKEGMRLPLLGSKYAFRNAVRGEEELYFVIVE